MKYFYRIISVLLLVMLAGADAFAFDHSHKPWENLLKKNVVVMEGGKSSRVVYSDFKRDEIKLKRYLNALSAVSKSEYDTWQKDQKLAFLINAYNAFTVELILKNWPVKSIKETGSAFKSPWKKKFITLFKDKVSLDDIEHGMIRKKGVFDEPRIHFAVVCASVGCPALQNSAFTADNLEMMLESGARGFLSDRTRNRYDPAKNVYEISKIFDWYGEDFKEKYGSVNGFLDVYAEVLVPDQFDPAGIKGKEIRIRYLDYNWNLNGM